jgi:hypothetical protein
LAKGLWIVRYEFESLVGKFKWFERNLGYPRYKY